VCTVYQIRVVDARRALGALREAARRYLASQRAYDEVLLSLSPYFVIEQAARERTEARAALAALAGEGAEK